MAKRQPKVQDMNVVLSKKMDNTIYNLMVRTTTDQVIGCNGYPLSALLADMRDAILDSASKDSVKAVSRRLAVFLSDNTVPDDFKTLQDIYRYVSNCEDSIKAIKKILNNDGTIDGFNKADETIRKELKRCKEMIARLMDDKVDMVTFDREIMDIRKKMYNNVIYRDSERCPRELIDGGIWIHPVD